MKTRVVVLGAGFAGLELAALLSEAFGEKIDVALIDKRDTFVFGFSKLDVMFGKKTADQVSHPYAEMVKLGVRFVRTTVRSMDPSRKRVVTDAGEFEADFLVVALGADPDPSATPGLVEGGNEFYTIPGAFALREAIAQFERGPAVIGIAGKIFKCPPAPSEAAMLLDEYLTLHGRRKTTEISLVMPFGSPVPPSAASSNAILAAFEQRGIRFVKDNVVTSLDPGRKVAVLSDGSELPYGIFLGVPIHKVPAVVVESGLAQGPFDWVPVNKETLETSFSGVFAVGDVNGVGTPKAGVFAEGAARVVAAQIVARVRGLSTPEPYEGVGSCYLEFGAGLVGRIDVESLKGPKPGSAFQEPSQELAIEKDRFGEVRLESWFGHRSASLG